MKKINKESKGVSIVKSAVCISARFGVAYLVGSSTGILLNITKAGKFMKFCSVTGSLGISNGLANYVMEQWDEMVDTYIEAYNSIVDLSEGKED